jgi:predicted nuclease of predicted toxin-antitoxin system
LRFLVDEDLPPKVAEVARNLGLDVVSVHEVGRRGYADDEQLRFAAREERVFITRNRNDFLLLSVDFYRAGEQYAGVLIAGRNLPNDRPERVAHALKQWVETRANVSESFGAVDFL